MRINVVIDDRLMSTAQKLSGLRTKKDTIEAGLNLLVEFKRQEKVNNFCGKVKWTGNLDEMWRTIDYHELICLGRLFYIF